VINILSINHKTTLLIYLMSVGVLVSEDGWEAWQISPMWNRNL